MCRKFAKFGLVCVTIVLSINEWCTFVAISVAKDIVLIWFDELDLAFSNVLFFASKMQIIPFYRKWFTIWYALNLFL